MLVRQSYGGCRGQLLHGLATTVMTTSGFKRETQGITIQKSREERRLTVKSGANALLDGMYELAIPIGS